MHFVLSSICKRTWRFLLSDATILHTSKKITNINGKNYNYIDYLLIIAWAIREWHRWNIKNQMGSSRYRSMKRSTVPPCGWNLFEIPHVATSKRRCVFIRPRLDQFSCYIVVCWIHSVSQNLSLLICVALHGDWTIVQGQISSSDSFKRRL